MRTNTLLTTEEVSREFLLTQQRATDTFTSVERQKSERLSKEDFIKNRDKLDTIRKWMCIRKVGEKYSDISEYL